MSFYAKERIEKLRKAIKKLPQLHEMTHAERIAYYCNLSRIDELKMEWGIQDYEEQEKEKQKQKLKKEVVITNKVIENLEIKQEERIDVSNLTKKSEIKNDDSNLVGLDENTQNALKKLWERR